LGKLLRVPFHDKFIESLGSYLLENCDSKDFSSCCVVFPGRRPSRFLLDYLKKKIKGSFLPPASFSIDDWMQHLFSLKRDERIPTGDFDLIYLLYRAIAESGIDEKSSLRRLADSVNNYIHWGGRLLNAMEEFEIQKAKKTEIEALAEYDENFLNWVRDFWKHFTSIRDKFYYLLRNNNLTYRGEVYNWTSENIEEITEEVQFDKIIFAGFYALNKSEDKMMRHLYSRNMADIIIQSDEIEGQVPLTSPYYFHKKWERDWGITFKELNKKANKKPHAEIHQCFDSHTEILTTEEILSGFKEKDINTAIVLPDSAPLIPLVSEVVQANKNDFNITMGYPLKRTSLFTLLKYVFSLAKTKKKTKDKNLYYLKDYINLIQHPWIKTIKKEAGEENFQTIVNRLASLLIEQNREDAKNFFSLSEIKELMSAKELKEEQEMKEALEILEKVHALSIKAFEEIGSLKEAAEKLHALISFLYEQSSIKKYSLNNQFVGKLFEKLEEIKNSLFSNFNFPDSYDIITFLESYLFTLEVRFIGDPLKGVQIMGMLETRNLNFDCIILLDVNEGTMPGVNKFDPLLPQGLRKIINLPTFEEKESMYAHNFFRLINGAKEVHLIFKEGKLRNVDKNIKSRFIEKIVWENEKKGEKTILDNRLFTPSVEALEKKEIKKSEKALKKLKEMEYSPTRIDTYLRCPLQFYYRYVLGLEEFMDIEEEVERSTIGKFTHDFLKDYYTQFIDSKLSPDKADFKKKLTEELERNFREGGGQLILRDIINTTLNRFMDYEIERAEELDIYIKDLEKAVSGVFDLLEGEAFKLKGRIDRVEETGGMLKVTDYKTGTVIKSGSTKGLTDDLSREMISNKIKSFQLPIYVYLYSKAKQIPAGKIQAGIYNIRKPREENNLPAGNMEIFLEALAFILEEITNPDIPFSPDPNHYCDYCPYRLMCSEG
jgi:ATP-dependent helicase/nuclease subunit B